MGKGRQKRSNRKDRQRKLGTVVEAADAVRGARSVPQRGPGVKITDAPVDPPPMPVGPAGITPTDVPGVLPGEIEAAVQQVERELTEQLPDGMSARFDRTPVLPDPADLSDSDLPGAWSRSDFTGGDPDERSYAERGWTPGGSLPEPIDEERIEMFRDRTGLRPLKRALKRLGWEIVSASDPMTTNGSAHERAFPPGAAERGRLAYVPLPATLDTDRQRANLVEALKRIGPVDGV